MKDFRLRTLTALFSLAALSGCGGHPKPEAGASPAAPPAAPAGSKLYCPQVAVLQQAQTLSTFLPGRSDVAAALTTATITGISGACVAEKHGQALLITVKAGFEADNGPANHGAPLSLPWFAAITRDDSILSKSTYQIPLKFDGNASLAYATSQPVKIEVPNVPDSANLQILVGFTMTPDQLAYAAAHPTAAP